MQVWFWVLTGVLECSFCDLEKVVFVSRYHIRRDLIVLASLQNNVMNVKSSFNVISH